MSSGDLWHRVVSSLLYAYGFIEPTVNHLPTTQNRNRYKFYWKWHSLLGLMKFLCTPKYALRGEIQIVKTKRNWNKVINLTYTIKIQLRAKHTRIINFRLKNSVCWNFEDSWVETIHPMRFGQSQSHPSFYVPKAIVTGIRITFLGNNSQIQLSLNAVV